MVGGEAAASYHIPQDLYAEILCRLPSKELLKLKAVCKDWLRLISSNGFIQKHLQRSKADCNHLTIMLNSNSCFQIFIDCAYNTREKIINFTNLLGCCDGLIIYCDCYERKIEAFNPSTGEFRLLVRITYTHPEYYVKLRWSLKFFWFGHHPFTADQYVLLLAYCESKSGIITFDLHRFSPDPTTDSLPLISSSTLDLQGMIEKIEKKRKMGTLLHKRLHFPTTIVCDSDRERDAFGIEFVILVYDFETNIITKMAHPGIKHPIRMLGVVDGCLCTNQEKEVWMMREYGVEESWTKYAKLDEFPLTFCPNGDVITISDGSGNVVSKYSWREWEAKIISKFNFCIGHDCIATVCIDSLISPTLLGVGREEKRNDY